MVDVSLDLIDNKLSKTLANVTFNLPLKNRNFKELIIAIKKHFYLNFYNKYKSFGSNSFSKKSFYHFNLISCNSISVGDLFEPLPGGNCQIYATAKSIVKKNLYAAEQKQFAAKFEGLTSETEFLWKKKSINSKTKRTKIQKLQKRYGKDFSYDKFYDHKLKHKEKLDTSNRQKNKHI